MAFHRPAPLRPEPVDIEKVLLSPRHTSPRGHSFSRSRRTRSNGVRLHILLITLMGVCIGASFLHFHAHLRELEALEGNSVPIDVVGVSLKPSCVTKQAVASLNLYLRPRWIHVVTTTAEKCMIYNSFAANVRCHIQDEFLPGVTTEAVGNYIRARLGVDQHKEFKGRQLSGWYMQQFVKLGAALALPGLTEHFIVWDLDMVLLSPVQVLFPDPDVGGRVQTLVNIGGSVSPGYLKSFRKLMKRGAEFAPDGSSFVTHWMVVYRPYMLEFLSELSGADAGPMGWVWRVLSSVDSDSAQLGFSEYISYLSWVKQHHPLSQRFAAHKTWIRHPFGQTTVRLLRYFRSDQCCCPSWMLLKLVKALGFVYTGYEVGHIAECRYSDPQYQLSYGLGVGGGGATPPPLAASSTNGAANTVV